MSNIISFDLPVNTVQDSVIPSPDSKCVAYIVKDHPGYHVEIDRTPDKVYEEIGGLTFRPDSTGIAYAGMRKTKWFCICNNEEIGPYDNIGKTSPVSSPDSKKIAYTALNGGDWFAMLDGKKIGGPYEGFAPGGIIFSPDSKKIAYSVKKGNKWVVIIDGEEYLSFYSLIERSLIFSPDSKKIAFIACNPERNFFRNQMKTFLIVDGENGPSWNYEPQSERNGILNEVIFSPDSQRIAYAICQNKKWSWIIDNEIQKGYDAFISGRAGSPDWAKFPDFGKTICRPQTLSFSPDSKHFAYAATDNGQSVLVYDGEELSRMASILNNVIAFSPDSSHIAFEAMENNQQFMVLDQSPLEKYWGICGESSFSPDSTLLAYISTKDEISQDYYLNVGNKKWLMPGGPLIGAHLVWDDNNTLHVIVCKKNRITKAIYHVR